jgi:acrylyl-CoA reductase (NADPH)
MEKSFKTYLVTEEGATFKRAIVQKNISELPPHDVLVRVHYSALNYKDALSATGNKGVTRAYPHTPGIDAAGIVEESKSPLFKKGDQVIVTSYDLGMNTSGGFSEYIRVPAGWVVPLPAGLSLKEAMILGTAGFTAGLALHKLEVNGQAPFMGPVLVTGATGGVGSMAVGILAKAGYEVIAATGKASEANYLKKLGATSVISRQDVDEVSNKPMLKGRWAAVIDTVGGNMLSTAIRSCGPNGNVAVCGLVASPSFTISVFPFIIRGVNLLGIESAECAMPLRQQIWQKLAGPWRQQDLDKTATYCTLEQLDIYINMILQGKTIGRVVVDLT